jgi:hypothetical protein
VDAHRAAANAFSRSNGTSSAGHDEETAGSESDATVRRRQTHLTCPRAFYTRNIIPEKAFSNFIHRYCLKLESFLFVN